MKSDRRHFTPEARIRALEARKANPKPVFDPNKLEIFVVRHQDQKHFVFQIRKFGGVILYQSDHPFDTAKQAWKTGTLVLAITEIQK